MDAAAAKELARLFLGREADDKELVAMIGQAERAAWKVAALDFGRGNRLFDVDPAGWGAVAAAYHPR